MIGSTPTAHPWRPPLDDAASQVRLLRLPAQQPHLEELTIELDVFSIAEAPKFQALSYSWRSPFPDEHPDTPSYHEVRSGLWVVNCNGHQVQVTRNLYEALKILIPRFPDSYLWNDVTCINQQDIGEVNTQVSMMAKIYAAAARVIIWLGKDDEETLQCLQLHRTIGKPLAELTNNGELGQGASPLIDELYRLNPGQPKLWDILDINAPTDDSWRAWTRFYRRSWFRRMWVIQEFISAQDISIMCGEHEFVPHYMRALAKFSTMAHWYSHISQLNRHSAQAMFAQIESRDSIVDGKLSAEDSRFLESGCGEVSSESRIILLIIKTRWKQASNPKDFIFVPLGIVKSLCESIGSLYDVDYGRDDFTSFAIVARHLLLNLPFLALLSFCGRSCQYGKPSSPMKRSWVPDFTARGMYPIGLIHRGCIAPYNASLTQNRPPYEYQRYRRVRESDLAFGLRGIRVDRLSTDVVALLSTTDPNGAAKVLRPLLRICQRLPPMYCNGQSVIEAVWRTLIDDIDVYGAYPATEATRREFRSWLARSIGLVVDHATDPESQSLAQDILKDLGIVRSSLDHEAASQSLPSLDDVKQHDNNTVVDPTLVGRYRRMIGLGNRFFFRTITGLLGIATNNPGLSDEVWILEDAKTPFLLRPCSKEGEYRVVGEVYVHGVMNGEIAPGREDEDWCPIWLV
ncbi:hypothetical protein N0V83_006815 [Neocucurbitaria cava]|uniref:Heterokaryon incompatibility domain-containing protein n=1 Tax=Neocucurbitaria cava TaxID=798079 RepID=A0A9W8Y636_9PLEO|nr:hypothetical protein N0V83_006815 [Neocucurbitaria cava]